MRLLYVVFSLRYNSNLCNRCEGSWSRKGKAECQQCPSDLRLTMFYVGCGAFAVIVVAVGMIASTMKSAASEKSRLSMMIKIFMSYLQLASLAGSFKLKWPAELLMMFEYQEGTFTRTWECDFRH